MSKSGAISPKGQNIDTLIHRFDQAIRYDENKHLLTNKGDINAIEKEYKDSIAALANAFNRQAKAQCPKYSANMPLPEELLRI